GRLAFTGPFRLVLASGSPRSVPTRIVIPHTYPTHEPLAYQVPPMWPHVPDRHFMEDGQICLWLDVESPWRADHPEALLAFLDQIAVFYLRQFIYDADPSRSFPGPARGHGLL